MPARVVVWKRRPAQAPQDTVLDALDALAVTPYLRQFRHFLLKPNYVIDAPASTGNVTDSRTVEGVIHFLRERVGVAPANIIVGEGGIPGATEGAMDKTGIREVTRRHGVRLVNLNKDAVVKDVPVPGARALHRVSVARTALEWADCLVSLPSLKTHGWAVTTLGMKNVMGAIRPKAIMHARLHEKIADLNALLPPRLVVIDGIVGSDGNEEGGHPVPMDLIIAGTDPVAVDTVGSAIIGYSPAEAKYLQHAARRGLGTADLAKIEIRGEPIERVARKFVR